MEDAASFPISDEGPWQCYSLVSKYLGFESGLFDFEVLEHFTQSLVDSECMSSMEGFSEANESLSLERGKESEAQKREGEFPKAIMPESKRKEIRT